MTEVKKIERVGDVTLFFAIMDSNLVLLRFSTFILILSFYLAVCAGDKGGVNENREDTGESNDETNETNESLGIDENEYTNNTVSCTRRQNSRLHEIRSAQHKQFPFMAAVMSHQDEYLCAGTVVSNGLILTTASCTLKPAKYVLLNTTKGRKDDTTVALHIIKTEKFPTFGGSETDKDVGIIFTEKHSGLVANKIMISNYSSTRGIVDLEALGFGLNSDMGQVKDLQYIGLENRQIASWDQRDLIRGYFDCVDTKVPTCFKDTGGPAIFNNELIGIVIKGQSDCIREMTATYALNKKLAEVLPTYIFKAWLDERLKKNEEVGPLALVTYPVKPTKNNTYQFNTDTGSKTKYSLSLSGAVLLIYLFI